MNRMRVFSFGGSEALLGKGISVDGKSRSGFKTQARSEMKGKSTWHGLGTHVPSGPTLNLPLN